MAHPPYDPHYLPPQPDYNSDKSSINTLFVSGLPNDVKAREIHNLFRRRPGFDNCQLKYTGRGNQVVAFATFFNQQSAIAALHALNGVKFDPQTGSWLHIELARSNSRRKRNPGSGAYVVIDKRSKKEDDNQGTSSEDADSESEEPSETSNHDFGDKSDLENTKRLKELEKLERLDIFSSKAVVDFDKVVAAVQEQPEKHVDGGQCSTLFIANLGPNCTEDELDQILSQYAGFNVVKLRSKGGMPVAFADFEEIGQANNAMDELRGTTLPSSDRGGMHIEYARSKMRKS